MERLFGIQSRDNEVTNRSAAQKAEQIHQGILDVSEQNGRLAHSAQNTSDDKYYSALDKAGLNGPAPLDDKEIRAISPISEYGTNLRGLRDATIFHSRNEAAS